MNLRKEAYANGRNFILCLTMIFMIVLTGMFCRIGQADSLFCAVTGKSQTLLSTETLIDVSETCTQELMKRTGSEILSNNRMVRTRTNLRIVLFFIIAGVVLRFLNHVLAAVGMVEYHQISSNTVIVNYIHHQDGKKR